MCIAFTFLIYILAPTCIWFNNETLHLLYDSISANCSQPLLKLVMCYFKTISKAYSKGINKASSNSRLTLMYSVFPSVPIQQVVSVPSHLLVHTEVNVRRLRIYWKYDLLYLQKSLSKLSSPIIQEGSWQKYVYYCTMLITSIWSVSTGRASAESLAAAPVSPQPQDFCFDYHHKQATVSYNKTPTAITFI